MSEIVVLGVFVADLVFRADRLPTMGETLLGNGFALGPGGKGSNQAVACGRLGADVSLITRLGEDDFAAIARQTWQEAGVKPVVQTRSETPTGAAFVFVDDTSGDNAIIITPGAAGEIAPPDLKAARGLIESAKVFITQLEQPLDAARHGLALARAAGVTTVLNPAPGQDLPDAVLGLCDIVTPNETEARDLTGIEVTDAASAQAACAALAARGVRQPIITMGARGVYLAGHGMVPARRFGPVVDTTGAGDAFNAGLVTALAEGQALDRAAAFGCAVAGLAVTKPGAAAAMPRRAEVEAAISSSRGQIMP